MSAVGTSPSTAPSGVTGAEPAHESLEIRRAQPDEYAEVDALITDAYAHDYGPSDGGSDPVRLAAVRDRDFDVWIARSLDGELLGSVTLRRRDGEALHEDTGPRELDLRLLGVSPSARRRGVGAALMRQAATSAAEAGYDAVVLKTQPNMLGAHRLYDSLGYVRAPERDGLWIGGKRILGLFTYVLPLAGAHSGAR